MAEGRALQEEKKDPLLSLAVHEVKGPVSVIAGYLSMLLRHNADALTDNQRRLLGEMQKAVGRCSAVLNQLGDLSRLQAGGTPLNRGTVHLAPLIEEEIAALPPLDDGRTVGVDFRNHAADAPVFGDAVRLRQAFGALLFALRRELVGDDELRVSIRRTPRDGAPMLQVNMAGSERFEQLEKLNSSELEPFHPEAEYRGGVGLTLPVARRIVEGHGGQIWTAIGFPKAGAIVLLPEK